MELPEPLEKGRDAHLGKDRKAGGVAYDSARDENLEMTDMLSAGILVQYPVRF